VREVATICPHTLQVDLSPFDLENGVRVTCDMGYLCANLSLLRPLCSGLRPDVRDRQTDVRQTDVRRASSLNAPYPRGGAQQAVRPVVGRHNMLATLQVVT